ncbi:MAG: TetR/AcrR family transcriptional regulator [Eggerthellaceae bacterium]|jgi:AcrR family transcriptional regulator
MNVDDPRSQRTREALMNAAFSLASEHSVSDISLTQIAKEAGVSRPAVYQQFGDVPSVVMVAAERYISDIFARIDEKISVGDDKDYLVGMMELFIQGVYEERDFCRNALSGPSGGKIAAHTIEFLSDRMGSRLIGKRLSAAGSASKDCLTAIAAGEVWLLEEWLNSDFADRNAPECIAGRMAEVMFRLSGIVQD